MIKESASQDEETQELATAINAIRSPTLRKIVTTFIRMLALHYDGEERRKQQQE